LVGALVNKVAVHIVKGGFTGKLAGKIKGDGTCGQIVGKVGKNFYVTDVGNTSGLNVCLFPHARIEQTGVKIPAVGKGRLAALIHLVTGVGSASRALGMGIDVNREDVVFAIEIFTQIQLKAAEHALVGIDLLAVDDHVISVINAAADKEDAIAVFSVIVEDGLVFPVVILQGEKLFVVVGIIQIFKIVEYTVVILDVSGNADREPLGGVLVAISAVPYLIKSHDKPPVCSKDGDIVRWLIVPYSRGTCQ
jgi:hypothetical protein